MPSSSSAGGTPPPAGGPGLPGPRRSTSPSILDLVRLSTDPIFPPGGEALYRQIALLTDMQLGTEVLDVACGRGVSTEFLVSTYGVEGIGIDPNPALVTEAEQRVRARGLEERLHFQTAPLDDLPYKDGIFDVVVGEVGLGTSVDAARAVQELARVTKPMGSVVLVQLIWTGNLDAERREVLVDHLGARPMLLVEWKQLLRDAGLVDLHVEDWSDHSSPFRHTVTAPFHDIGRIFTLRQKVRILQRALRRWGWRGVRGAIVREQEIHRQLTHQRVLGLSLVRGVKWNGGP